MQGHGHFKGAHSVHVGCYDGYAAVASFGISEGKAAHQIHLRQAHKGTHSVLYQVCLTGFKIMMLQRDGLLHCGTLECFSWAAAKRL